MKVLDFGLAKAFQPDASDPSLSQSPTISLTAAATQMGMVLGTAAYMAPEQAKGKVVDKRADVWAFGVVLFEMLTGTRPFAGDDVSETLARVIDREPDWDTLPDNVPPGLSNFLRHCLQKNPKKRIRDIGDVSLAMEGAFETTVSQPSVAVDVRSLQVWQRPAAVSLIALVAAMVTGVAVWGLIRPAPRPVTRSLLTPPPTMPLNIGIDVNVALTPDGTHVVYRGLVGGQPHLFVRPLAALDATPPDGAECRPPPPVHLAGW